MQAGRLLEIEIDSMAYGGAGVGRHEGLVIFVPYSAPGDRLQVEITAIKSRFLQGRIREILRASGERTVPPCPYFGNCGGCCYQHLLYDRQLHWKETQVRNALARIGKVSSSPLAQIMASPENYHYRGKVELHVARGEDGRLRLGFHQTASNLLIEVKQCAIAHRSINQTLIRLGRELESRRISSLPPRFTLWSGPGEEGWAAIDVHATVERTVKDKIFSVPAAGFFQANLFLVERLVDLVLELSSLEGRETVIDCFCGSGLFSLFLAPLARRLYGIEADGRALDSARRNQARYGNGRAVFLHGDAAEVIRDFFLREKIRVDLLLLDPPRPGLAVEAMAAILALKPQRLLYVSCNPTTLARDIKILTADLYRLCSLQPLDMFPQTGHIETVALLARCR